MFAAQIGDGNPRLVLLQNADDLIFGEPAALHLWSSRLGQSLTQTGLGGGGNVMQCQAFGGGRLWAENDYLPTGRTIIHVNAMSTNVRHFLSVRHGGCWPMSASFRAENL